MLRKERLKTLLKYGADVTAVKSVFKDGFPKRQNDLKKNIPQVT